jgi:TonB-linked SusC/RagA family outer membrane protein
MRRLRILLTCCFCLLLSTLTKAQQQEVKLAKVKITVKDLEDGIPLDSALVRIGDNKGYTDSKGYIEFDDVLTTASVQVVYEGYVSQLQKVKAVIKINLYKLEPNEQTGNGIINNGFYKRPNEHFSGSATVVSGDELRNINPNNFLDGLKNFDPALSVISDNTNGSNPNALPSVQIRGANSFPASASIAKTTASNSLGLQVNASAGDFIASQITNPNQPLIMLDGAQVSMQVALDMDINRIESVTILKDAAAATIYGIRGASGVILIETKQPKREDLHVTYSTQLQISTPDLSSYHLLNAAAKLQLENTAGMYASNPSLYQSRLSQVNNGTNTNWLSVPLDQRAIGSKQSLSIEGGADVVRYGIDFSTNDVQGVMKGSDRKNTNLGVFFSTQIKGFVIKNYFSFNKNQSDNSPYGNFSNYAKQNPYWSPTDPATGQPAKVLESYVVHLPGRDSTIYHYNPAYNASIATTNTTSYSRFSDNLSFDGVLAKDLHIAGRVAISKVQDQGNMFLPPDNTAFAYYIPAQYFLRGLYTQTASDFLSVEGGLQLNYSKKVGLHQFNAAIGSTALTTQSQSTSITVGGFTTDNEANLSFGNAYTTLAPAAGMVNTRLLSNFANLSYSYDNRYQVELIGAADAASQLGANNPIADLGAASVSWNVHQESFFHPNDILNQLRLHASIGTTGSQNFQSYLGTTGYRYFANQQYYTTTLPVVGQGDGAYLTGYANPNLKAPQTLKQDVGLEMGLFKNRLFIRVDGYIENSKNLVLPVSTPASAGFNQYSYYDNLGGIENKGIEFSLNYSIIKNKNIYWSVSVNGTHNTNRITAISSYINTVNSNNNAFSVDQTTIQPKYVVGQSLTAIWAVPSLGIDPATGLEEYRKKDGSTTTTWDPNDKTVAGDMTPKWAGSFGTSLTVKAFTAGIYFNYQLGGQMYNQTLADMENADLTYNVDSRAVGNRWTQPGTSALYKPLALNGLLTSPTYATTRFVQNNDLINCSSISLNYALSFNFLQKIGLQNTKVGVIANNLFQTGGTQAEQGINYPFEHIFSLNLTTTF